MRRCRVSGANHDFYQRLLELMGKGTVIVENLTNLAGIPGEIENVAASHVHGYYRGTGQRVCLAPFAAMV